MKLLKLPGEHAELEAGRLADAAGTLSRRATAAGTATTSFVRLARRGFAKAVRPFGARKMTVFAVRLALKFRPWMVSGCRTLTRIGRTRVIDGFEAFLPVAPDAAGALTSRAVADSASRQMVKRRRIAIPLSTVPVAD